MRIYGAGLAGLLAANMLRRYKPLVCEAQPELPNNHDALLRFRTDAVSRVTGIPFKKVMVHKAICYNDRIFVNPNLKYSNWYSRKVTDEVAGRSIMNLEPVERYIAPQNLIEQLSEGVEIQYKEPLAVLKMQRVEPIIATIPMPLLMCICEWQDKPAFNYRTITSITCDIVDPKVDVYQTLYYPDPYNHLYRASITGNHLILEIMGMISDHAKSNEELVSKVCCNIGINPSKVNNLRHKVQNYGKIVPIDDDVRRQFILALSDIYYVYSVGRYATWRQILLDDVVNDIHVVEKFINQRDRYRHNLLTATV